MGQNLGGVQIYRRVILPQQRLVLYVVGFDRKQRAVYLLAHQRQAALGCDRSGGCVDQLENLT